MPIYEYKCTSCENQMEALQKISDPSLKVCPACGGELNKLISNTSFVLKGGGWYADGYSSTNGGGNGANGGNGSTDTAEKKAQNNTAPAEKKATPKADSAPAQSEKKTA